MNVSVDFSNVCASFAISPIAACAFGAGVGMAVTLAVTLYKCFVRPLARRFHH